MKIARELEQLCTICINHFDELDKDKTGKIKVFSIELKSYEIWAGDGDRYEDNIYYITKDGWIIRNVIKETGLYANGERIIEDSTRKGTPGKIEADINGDKATIFDAKALFSFYDKIYEMYSNEFKIFI